MKIQTSLVRSLTLAVGLCAASNIVNASIATFSDSWKDTPVLDSDVGAYTNKTTGTFSVDLSLPVAISANFNLDTEVSLAGLFDNKLRDDPNYTVKGKSAKFPIILKDGTTNGSVTVSWSATTFTITGSSKTDVLGAETWYTSSFTSNFFLRELHLTVVTNTDNGSGTDFDWDNTWVPVVAKNTTTTATHTNEDGSLNVTLVENGSLTGTADFTPPSLTVAFPANNYRFNSANPILAMHGTAADKYGVATVGYYVSSLVAGVLTPVNGGAPFIVDPPPGTDTSLSWSANVDLTGWLGTNIITVFAVNNLTNSNTVSRTVIMYSNSPVSIQVFPAGAGKVTGLKSNQVVQMNNEYAVSATPASSKWIFSQWTNGAGTVLSISSTFVYQATNTDNTLVATFLPNPFYDSVLAGAYEALFLDTNGVVAPTNAGYINLNVTSGAAYTGRIYLPSTGTSFPISGQLSLPGDGTLACGESKVTVSKSLALDVQLTITNDPTLAAASGMLGGTVSATSYVTNQLWSATNNGELVMDSPVIPAGIYNVVITPTNDPSGGPGGYSFATATVSKTGGVVLALTLADGTTPVTSFSTALTYGGVCPVYAPLYSGSGVIIGTLQFATDGSGNVGTGPAPLTWWKSPVKDKFYTNGFVYNPLAFGAIYKPLSIFDWTTNGFFDVDEGYAGYTLADDRGGVAITFNPAKNTLVDPVKRDHLTITLNPTTGALSGSFAAANTFADLSTNTIATPTFRGVVTLDAGWGFFAATNHVPDVGLETGPVSIGADK